MFVRDVSILREKKKSKRRFFLRSSSPLFPHTAVFSSAVAKVMEDHKSYRITSPVILHLPEIRTY